jgi:hypothetical protein
MLEMATSEYNSFTLRGSLVVTVTDCYSVTFIHYTLELELEIVTLK